MHDTVNRIRKRIRDDGPRDDFAELFSQRLQEGGVSRALAEPLSAQVALLYQEAFRWLRAADRYAQLEEGADPIPLLRQLHFASRHLAVALGATVPFLERAEDTLSEKEDVTHRESGYEREVAPFSRVDSTLDIRERFAKTPGFTVEAAGEAAQIAGDLLKVVYIEKEKDRIQVEIALQYTDAYSETRGYYYLQHDAFNRQWYFSVNGTCEDSRELFVTPYYADEVCAVPERARGVARVVDHVLRDRHCFPMPISYPQYRWYGASTSCHFHAFGMDRFLFGGCSDSPYASCVGRRSRFSSRSNSKLATAARSRLPRRASHSRLPMP